MERLRQRAEFLAAAAGAKVPAAGFVLQARPRDDEAPPRVGFTVSRKVGNGGRAQPRAPPPAGERCGVAPRATCARAMTM